MSGGGGDQPYLEMISVLGHELRRPLTVIRGAATLLADAGDGLPPERARDMLRMIDTHVEDMSELIEDLLLMCHLEAGDTSLFVEPVTVSDLVEAALEAARPRLGQAGVETDVAAGLEVEIDLSRSVRALRALLENAARFSPEGAPVRLVAVPEDGFVRLRVTDSGPGIPADLGEAAFDRFRRGEGQAAGLGVGLYLARGLARAQGGEAGLETPAGGGASVWIRLRRRG